MSMPEIQEIIGNGKKRVTEGIKKYNLINSDLETWCSEFSHYLSSSMSYTNSRTLSEYIGKAEFNHVTENSFNRLKK